MHWLRDLVEGNRSSNAVFVEQHNWFGQVETFTYAQVIDAAIALANQIRPHVVDASVDEDSSATVGIVASNSVDWVVADLAGLIGGFLTVPIPMAFAAEQARHLLSGAGVLLTDDRGRFRLNEWDLLPNSSGPVVIDIDTAHLALEGRDLPTPAVTSEDWVCKSIHTSGTTSLPKGVRVRSAAIQVQIEALNRRVPGGKWLRYLSIVPLSLLIEQITAIYMTAVNGGTIVFLPADLPLIGTTPTAVGDVVDLLAEIRPGAFQAPPALYEEIARRTRAANAVPGDDTIMSVFGTEHAPFAACGGAPIAPEVLSYLQGLGIEIYQGYGLSENTSVVAWNSPSANRPGSVGLPLDHVDIRIEESGELAITSKSLFDGYSNADPSSCEFTSDGWLRTGDLAEVDADGYLYIRGRMKNVFITASGRNIAPDWLASQYRTLPEIQEAVIFADGAHEVTGFFVLADGVDESQAAAAVEHYGRHQLSAIDAVDRAVFVPSTAPDLGELFTVTGRPRRNAIEQLLADQAPSRSA